jgi:hypothetical protein
MNRRRALKTLAGLALCPTCASTGVAAERTHWTYGGSSGPDKWGDVDAESKVCSLVASNRQSTSSGRSKPNYRCSGSPGARPPTPLSTTVTQSNYMRARGIHSVLAAGLTNYCSFTSIIRASTSSAASAFRWRRILSMPVLRARSPRGRCADGGRKAQPGIQQDHHNQLPMTH